MLIHQLPLQEQAIVNESVEKCRDWLQQAGATTITTRYMKNKVIVIGTPPTGKYYGYKVTHLSTTPQIIRVHHFRRTSNSGYALKERTPQTTSRYVRRP